jgi:hypothetical protein
MKLAGLTRHRRGTAFVADLAAAAAADARSSDTPDARAPMYNLSGDVVAEADLTETLTDTLDEVCVPPGG